MAQDVVEPVNLAGPLPAPFRTPQKSEKKRLNWLSWMRKSLGGKKKLCACGFYHHHDKDQEWPVFTTQMSSQSGKHFGIKIQSLRKLSWLQAKANICIILAKMAYFLVLLIFESDLRFVGKKAFVRGCYP